ncbi:hypothetical protein X975_13270, partial [Stegodyphus mimosarum]
QLEIQSETFESSTLSEVRSKSADWVKATSEEAALFLSKFAARSQGEPLSHFSKHA